MDTPTAGVTPYRTLLHVSLAEPGNTVFEDIFIQDYPALPAHATWLMGYPTRFGARAQPIHLELSCGFPLLVVGARRTAAAAAGGAQPDPERERRHGNGCDDRERQLEEGDQPTEHGVNLAQVDVR